MDIKPVIVGVDGSLNSKGALRWAAEYGQRYEAPVHAITTWELPSASYPMGPDEQQTVSLEAEAQALLGNTFRDVLGEESQVVKRVEQGHPAATLLAAAQSAQLLVVGTRGHGAFVGMLIGSVSQHCVQNAPCPVVVVPHEDIEETPPIS